MNCVARLHATLWQHDRVFTAKSPAMRAFKEISIDLSADDLLSPLPPAPASEAMAEQDTVEIELTAEQMDALLSGRPF